MTVLKRRKKRRLKKGVRRGLWTFSIVVALLIARPWSWFFVSSEVEASSIIVDSLQPMALNQLLDNSLSDLPEAAKFDKAVERFMNQWEIQGASIAIMKDGNLIYSKGYGWANLQDSIAMDVRHIMRIASVSKLITAVGIMKLCESGRLRLDAKVFGRDGLLPEYMDYRDRRIENITVEHLLRHRGGFRVRSGDPMFDAHKMGVPSPMTPQKMIDFVLNRGLGFAPGSGTSYSNVGYLILGQVIERRSFVSYESYIRDSILAPVGIYDMHIGKSTDQEAFHNEVRYYEPSDSELIPACDGSNRMVVKSNGGNDIALLGAAGGWVASPVELLKLVTAIDTKNERQNILTPASIRRMTTFSKAELPIGWMRITDRGDWWRSGTMAGTSAMLRRGANGYTWVFITNTSSWKGSRFPSMINTMIQQAFNRVEEWPEKDLFGLVDTDTIPTIDPSNWIK